MRKFLVSSLMTLTVLSIAATGALAGSKDRDKDFWIFKKLSFGETKTLYKNKGIKIKAMCIQKFDRANWCDEGDIPPTGQHVTRLFMLNDSAEGDPSARVGAAADNSWGECNTSTTGESHDFIDRHIFRPGETLTLVTSHAEFSADPAPLDYNYNDIEGQAKGMTMVYHSNGDALLVNHAMATVKLFGADCSVAIRGSTRRGKKSKKKDDDD